MTIWLIPRASAEEKFRIQIGKGEELKNRSISDQDKLRIARADFNKWDDYNKTLIRKVFTDDDILDEYSPDIVYVGGFGGRPSFDDMVRDYRRDVQKKTNTLNSIYERLELFEEQSETQRLSGVESGNKIFVVHGHDETFRLEVADTLHRLALDPVILFEKPNEGRTIIEKLEEESTSVSYAIVLLSGDDKCVTSDQSEEMRARQNVVFEFGYFVGRLGRRRVCVIKKGDVVIHSDIDGVVYIDKDDGGAWRMKLSQELRTAGFMIDTNRLL